MKISVNILIPAAMLALFSCAEPKKDNVVEVTPGAPLFPASQPAASAQGGATGNVNPAHGQPGHNCAVPVGAPLPASGQTAVPASGQTPTPGTNAAPATAVTPAALPVASPVQAAPGTNPAHGQPGHDCAVAVGAPLPTK